MEEEPIHRHMPTPPPFFVIPETASVWLNAVEIGPESPIQEGGRAENSTEHLEAPASPSMCFPGEK